MYVQFPLRTLSHHDLVDHTFGTAVLRPLRAQVVDITLPTGIARLRLFRTYYFFRTIQNSDQIESGIFSNWWSPKKHYFFAGKSTVPYVPYLVKCAPYALRNTVYQVRPWEVVGVGRKRKTTLGQSLRRYENEKVNHLLGLSELSKN